MDKKTIILIFVLFALLVAGMFVYAYLKKGEVSTSPTSTVQVNQ